MHESIDLRQNLNYGKYHDNLFYQKTCHHSTPTQQLSHQPFSVQQMQLSIPLFFSCLPPSLLLSFSLSLLFSFYLLLSSLVFPSLPRSPSSPSYVSFSCPSCPFQTSFWISISSYPTTKLSIMSTN